MDDASPGLASSRRTAKQFARDGAGWSSPVARQAHNLKAAGSNPAPATIFPWTPITGEKHSASLAMLPQRPADHTGRPHVQSPTTKPLKLEYFAIQVASANAPPRKPRGAFVFVPPCPVRRRIASPDNRDAQRLKLLLQDRRRLHSGQDGGNPAVHFERCRLVARCLAVRLYGHAYGRLRDRPWFVRGWGHPRTRPRLRIFRISVYRLMWWCRYWHPDW